MSTISALQSGLNGYQSGINSLNNNALKIAQNVTQQPEDLVDPLVGLLQDKQQVQASIKVIETSNDMLGSLLDITV
jgi:uncharacterized phage infection (PIP) family protein YhgE